MTDTQGFACPCQSGQPYADCCAPLHQGRQQAPTAVALMRSRYSAFALGGLGQYLYDTWHDSAPEKAELTVDMLSTRDAEWHGLDVIKVREQGVKAQVEFCAWFGLPGESRRQSLHERSRFIKEHGRWFYVEGVILPTAATKTPARNAPCPCGSGKKYKRCCGQ